MIAWSVNDIYWEGWMWRDIVTVVFLGSTISFERTSGYQPLTFKSSAQMVLVVSA